MRKYTFLLLAFFLGISNLFGANKTNSAIKQTTPRNVEELANTKEPTHKDDSSNLELKHGNPSAILGKNECKTYEGVLYHQGEPGYTDCIRTVKNERQSTKTVP